MSKIKETYKSSDTEEFLDKIFYRPIGYVIALGARSLHLTPNQVTIASIFAGVAGGHMFYYSDIELNIYGILLMMFAQALDGADGQLARMTNSQSRVGRILDGVSDNLKFISVYVHLIIRLLENDYTPWIIPIAVVSGFSHALQSAMADYSRNFYVYYALDKEKSEIDESSPLKEKYKNLSWKKEPVYKFLIRVYLNYTIQQEFIAYKMKELYAFSKEKFGSNIPDWFGVEYKKLHKPLLKWYNILTSNTRLIALFIGLLVGFPEMFWAFELTVLNFLLLYVVFKHNKNSEYLQKLIIKKLGNQ